MKKKISQFEKWFRKQFGKLPHDCRPYREILTDLAEAERQVARLTEERDEHVRLQEQWRVASYVRNAAAKKFSF